MSAASCQTQSKDLMFPEGATGNKTCFRIAVRFFDEHDTEHFRGRSREAATECSPRRKPWVQESRVNQPRRGERNE